jgi:hypothetical protein
MPSSDLAEALASMGIKDPVATLAQLNDQDIETVADLLRLSRGLFDEALTKTCGIKSLIGALRGGIQLTASALPSPVAPNPPMPVAPTPDPIAPMPVPPEPTSVLVPPVPVPIAPTPVPPAAHRPASALLSPLAVLLLRARFTLAFSPSSRLVRRLDQAARNVAAAEMAAKTVAAEDG